MSRKMEKTNSQNFHDYGILNFKTKSVAQYEIMQRLK